MSLAPDPDSFDDGQDGGTVRSEPVDDARRDRSGHHTFDEPVGLELAQLDVSGPNGRIEALNLRLYEPQAQRWSLTFVNLRDGLLTPAVYGGFRDGVGEFYGDDQLDGRPIKVRFLIVRVSMDEARFEQAFSVDDGATWETNWIAVDRRIRS